jgi:hypothetical protein
MEFESLLPCSQELSTPVYLQQMISAIHASHLTKIHFNIIISSACRKCELYTKHCFLDPKERDQWDNFGRSRCKYMIVKYKGRVGSVFN